MSGPAWECPPEILASGRIVYRCLYGHMHPYPTAAWACGGNHESEGRES